MIRATPHNNKYIVNYIHKLKIKIPILALLLLINISCVENIITIQILSDGRTLLKIVSTGDSTDVIDKDFEHPFYNNKNRSYSLNKTDSIWKATTQMILEEPIFNFTPEYGLSYDFQINKSENSISNIYNLKMNFYGRGIKKEYPNLYSAITSNKLDSLTWIPEALTVIIDKALKQLEMSDKYKTYKINRPRLVNHFKNSFSRITTFSELQNIQKNRTMYIQNTLKPFKLKKDFANELSKYMIIHEERLKASLGLQDDNFVVKILLPGDAISGNAMSMNEDTLIWKFGLDSLLDKNFQLYAKSVVTSKDKVQKTTILIIFCLLIFSIILIKK